MFPTDLLRQIPNLFSNQSEDSVLQIEKDEKEVYSLSVINEISSKEAMSSFEHFGEIVGRDRLKRLYSHPGVGLKANEFEQKTAFLTKSFVRKIFIALLDVHISDMKNLTGSEGYYYAHLLGFETIKEVESAFMGCCPDRDRFQIDKASTSGKGLKGLAERIYTSVFHHFQVIEEENKLVAELRDIEMLTSRLADREMQEGSVIHLSDGFFYVDKVFFGGGAYISILCDIKNEKAPKIICRGTAMRRTATEGFMSGINDILLEIGTVGIKAIWPQLARYLKQKEFKSIHVLGKSLGGAFAQELALLIEGTAKIKVEKLTTYCSVGVGKAINELFKKEILEGRDLPFQIQVVRNGGNLDHEVDFIPAMGGVHLGEGTEKEKCNVEVCYIQPEGEGEVGIFPENISKFSMIKNFFKSFSLAHCRQTTLGSFKWKVIQGHDDINKHLRVGEQLEKIRKCFAYIIHLFTLFILNGKSFYSFFHNQKQLIS